MALEYAYRYGYEYDHIWWVNAETEDTIFASFLRFALKNNNIDENTKESEIIIEAVRDWMQQHDNWLFIYDNAEEFEKKEGREFENYLPKQNIGRRHVLITSRNRNWKHLATVITLEVFSPKEAADFLTHRTGLPRNEFQDELAKKLGYLSLALEQAGAYICNNGNCDYEEYLNLLEEYQLELFKDSPDTITKKSVHATWDISFKKKSTIYGMTILSIQLSGVFGHNKTGKRAAKLYGIYE